MTDSLKITAEGVPKNWRGEDWQAYKFAMQMVFLEAELMDIVERTITKSMLLDAEGEEKFDKKQIKIMRLIGMSVPSEILQQIRDKTRGTETLKCYNIRTELQTLQYAVDDIDMVEMMLESLPGQAEFESLKSSLRYSADMSLFTPTKVRELIRAAAARQGKFRGKGNGGQRGGLRTGSSCGAGENANVKTTRKCDYLSRVCDPPSPDHNNGDAGAVLGGLDQIILDARVEVEIWDHEQGGSAHEVHGTDAANADDTNDWWFGSAANAYVTGNLPDFVAFTEDISHSQSVHGVAPALASRIAGVGIVALVTEVDGERGVVSLNDVVYVPGAEHGLFSPGLAAEQGFGFNFDHNTQNFRIEHEGRTVIEASPYEATRGFFVTHPKNEGLEIPRDRALCNFTAIDGVASFALWHERLGHICPQYLKPMADKGLLKGMMLMIRGLKDSCDACHQLLQVDASTVATLKSKYAEDVVGCKVYLPEERTARFVAGLRVAEDVVYRDRHQLVDDADMESLHFEHVPAINRDIDVDMENTVDDTITDEQGCNVMASAVESSHFQPYELEGGEDASVPGERSNIPEATASVEATLVGSREAGQTQASATHLEDIESVIAQTPTEVESDHGRQTCRSPPQEAGHETVARDQMLVDPEVDRCDGNESITGVCGSIDESVQLEVDEAPEETIEHKASVVDDDQVTIPRNRCEVNRSKCREFRLPSELEEMNAMRAKGVTREFPREDVPMDAKLINARWVRSLKSDQHGYVTRFKSWVVALGNYQRPGIDFTETFTSVARMPSFRMITTPAAVLHPLLSGGDINTAYMNALLKILQYLKSIDGYSCGINGPMYMMVKALYGLRQFGREWNTELTHWLLARGYLRSLTEPCLYYKIEAEPIVLVLVYVDDIVVATNNETEKCNLFNELDEAYGIKDQGSLDEGERSDTSFDYRKAIGMLMDLAAGTRPDLAFVVGQLSRYVSKPSARHVGTLKRVLRYLAGTLDNGITHRKLMEVPDTVVLDSFCDSDWTNDPESRKSSTGFVFVIGRGAVSWMSRLHSVVALSTAEAEYVAACEAAIETVAASNILQEICQRRMWN
ncbi:unnamed protein product [Phytophthora fragariaefolia]|uniref:Unnamed protein product n=1 Tax=Phytophthora fragariaefolia TaxID=1490495 RepID=A0A9W6XN89_9STRA|nr:unnamed protein product [Phytophthora fragariaefolia]